VQLLFAKRLPEAENANEALDIAVKSFLENVSSVFNATSGISSIDKSAKMDLLQKFISQAVELRGLCARLETAASSASKIVPSSTAGDTNYRTNNSDILSTSSSSYSSTTSYAAPFASSIPGLHNHTLPTQQMLPKSVQQASSASSSSSADDLFADIDVDFGRGGGLPSKR
jgi:hypothetical protein